MRIRILSTETETISGNKNGRDWTMTNQKAICQVGNETREIKTLIPKNASPWAVGDYEIDFDKSCYVSGFGNLTLSAEIKLKCLTSAQNKAA